MLYHYTALETSVPNRLYQHPGETPSTPETQGQKPKTTPPPASEATPPPVTTLPADLLASRRKIEEREMGTAEKLLGSVVPGTFDPSPPPARIERNP